MRQQKHTKTNIYPTHRGASYFAISVGGMYTSDNSPQRCNNNRAQTKIISLYRTPIELKENSLPIPIMPVEATLPLGTVLMYNTKNPSGGKFRDCNYFKFYLIKLRVNTFNFLFRTR